MISGLDQFNLTLRPVLIAGGIHWCHQQSSSLHLALKIGLDMHLLCSEFHFCVRITSNALVNVQDCKEFISSIHAQRRLKRVVPAAVKYT